MGFQSGVPQQSSATSSHDLTELNEVGLKVQHIRGARGQGLIINSVAPLREGGRQK